MLFLLQNTNLCCNLADLKALVGDDDDDPEFKFGMPLEIKRGPGRPRGYRVKRGQYRPRRPKEEIEAEKANRRKRLRQVTDYF